mmetsp:Transcript_81016/g.203957  ORF Transcript_81016/g.203957 Transcript_81016/m.203957 type:complete len:876 (-) Transcript_81016:418-3045(-)
MATLSLWTSFLVVVGFRLAVASAAADTIVSNDTVFLWSHTNHTIDVDKDVARARWQNRGSWQALRIVKAGGVGAISSGELVFIKGHTGDCLQLKPDTVAVAALPGRCPTWNISHADNRLGLIKSGDSISLMLTHMHRYLDIHGDEDGLVRAQWNFTGTWQTLVVEREDPDAVMAGEHITLAAHTGALVDAQDKLVRARWPQVGAWRAIVLEADENLGPWMQSFAIYGGDGRALYAGDRVTLWAATGKLVDVETQVARARWDKSGIWQRFHIEKKGGGVIRHGDPIFLKAHTGKYLEVRGEAVEAIGELPTDAGTLVINLAGSQDRTAYRQCAVMAVLAFGTISVLVYELCQPRAPAPKGGAPRLEALDAVRWIASVQIVLCHFYDYTWGCAWTQFFFVLSGFVLSYVEMARPVGKGPQISQLRYVTHRAVTLYPTYIVTLVVGAIQWSGHSALDWMTLPLHLLLMQSWFPITYKKLGRDSWQWSGLQWAQVSWFVSVLVIYWLMLRPLTRRVRRMSLTSCCCAAFTLWAISAAWWYLHDVLMRGKHECEDASQRCFALFNQYVIYHGWLGMLHVFVSGIVMARIFILTSMKDAEVGGPVTADTQRLALDPKRAPCFFRFGCCLGYLAFGLLVVLVGKDGYHENVAFYHNGGILPVMLLMLVGGSLGEDPMARYLFQNRVFKMLGRISYAQYLIQFNVWGIVNGLFPKGHAMVSPKVVFPFALFVLSYIMERLVTRVGNEWLKPSKEKQRTSSVNRVVTWLESKCACRATEQPAESSAPLPLASADLKAPPVAPPEAPQGITLLESNPHPPTDGQTKKSGDIKANAVSDAQTLDSRYSSPSHGDPYASSSAPQHQQVPAPGLSCFARDITLTRNCI